MKLFNKFNSHSSIKILVYLNILRWKQNTLYYYRRVWVLFNFVVNKTSFIENVLNVLNAHNYFMKMFDVV